MGIYPPHHTTSHHITSPVPLSLLSTVKPPTSLPLSLPILPILPAPVHPPLLLPCPVTGIALLVRRQLPLPIDMLLAVRCRPSTPSQRRCVAKSPRSKYHRNPTATTIILLSSAAGSAGSARLPAMGDAGDNLPTAIAEWTALDAALAGAGAGTGAVCAVDGTPDVLCLHALTVSGECCTRFLGGKGDGADHCHPLLELLDVGCGGVGSDGVVDGLLCFV
ncbi:hypothetical protein CC80DRAFT_284176 [Byssothecium circinans]|uniref:Uncharacterized protein n=1 Tax=Byssothecium circinans TaxID=147558 RepID=A0A6A5UG31_9PLEO|nr:hypothetical protein CC80DRAFT_284176 [Byssothecium circinans]